MTSDNHSEWRRASRKRQSIYHSLIRKSLDLPEEDMQVNVDNSHRNGLKAPEAIVMSTLLGITALAVGYGLIKKDPVQNTIPPVQYQTPAETNVNVVDTEYEVRFYDSEGEPIEVSTYPGSSAFENNVED